MKISNLVLCPTNIFQKSCGILFVQLSSLKVSGPWPLAIGLLSRSLAASLWVGQQKEASSQ